MPLSSQSTPKTVLAWNRHLPWNTFSYTTFIRYTLPCPWSFYSIKKWKSGIKSLVHLQRQAHLLSTVHSAHTEGVGGHPEETELDLFLTLQTQYTWLHNHIQGILPCLMISLHWHFWDALSKHMPACSTNAAKNITSTQFLGAEKVELIKKTSDYITWCQYWTWIGPFYAVVPHSSFSVLTDGLFAQHKGRWLDKNSLTQLWEDGQETQSKPQR